MPSTSDFIDAQPISAGGVLGSSQTLGGGDITVALCNEILFFLFVGYMHSTHACCRCAAQSCGGILSYLTPKGRVIKTGSFSSVLGMVSWQRTEAVASTLAVRKTAQATGVGRF